jgi:ariadne-1
MVCAAPWKTCNCPWFNYQNLDEDDRLNDMRVPYDSRQDVIEVLEEPVEPSPPIRRSSTRVRHRSDHTHDHPDEVLAAQLQSQLRFDPAHVVSELRRSDPDVQMYSIGNLGTHHMNESYTVRPLATSAARAAVRQSTPRWFTRSTSVREPPRAPAPQSTPAVQASLMAGLSRDGTRRGANRVGTWLNHVQVDHDAIHTARKDVEVDDWNVEGSMVGID